MRGLSGDQFQAYQEENFRLPALREHYPIFIIGDAPRRDDDRRGRGWGGDSGELLFELLKKANAPFEDIYLTYLVKCMTPKGRDPAAAEIRACFHHVYREIRQYRPKMIILLGRLAMKLFFSQGRIGTMRGELFRVKLPKWEDGPEFAVVPTYQPAYLFARDDPKLRTRVVQDLKMAFRVAQGGSHEHEVYPVQYKAALTVDDVREMVNEIKEHRKFSFDTESPDLRFRYSPMILMQFSLGKGRTWVVPWHRHDPNALGEFKMRPQFTPEERKQVIEILREILEDPDMDIYGANLKYDCNVARAWLSIEVAGRLWDVSGIHHLFLETPPHSLEYLADLEFAIGNYSEAVHDIVGGGEELTHTYDWIPDEILWPYGATDAEMSYRLAEVFRADLEANPGLYNLYIEETQPAIRCFQDAEWVGVKVNLPAVNRAEKYFTDVLENIRAKFAELVGPDFNPNSNPQIADYLINEGFREQITDNNKSTGICVDKNVLAELDHPIAPLLLEFRKANKRLTTYVKNLKRDSAFDGRVRYTFNIHKLVTGRISCSVLHQIPRLSDSKDDDAILRDLFEEEEDFDIIYADFDQMELRVFAYLTQEQELIKALEDPNQDVHANSAAAALACDPSEVSDFNRSSIGKPLNFGGLYGSKGDQVAKCQYEDPKTGKITDVGEARAAQFMRNLNEKYTRIGALFGEVEEEALLCGGVVTTIFGRQRHLPEILGSDEYRSAKAEREGVNFKIQSAASSIATRTVILVREMLLGYGVGLNRVRFLFSVHDSVVYGVHKSLTPWFRDALKIIAERGVAELHSKSLPISLGSGRTWGDAERNSKKKEV